MAILKGFRKHLIQNSTALVIAVIGYFLAGILNFPAPALTGPAFFVSIVCLAGVRIDIHLWLRNCAFVLIGIAMGTSVTPEVLQAAETWPESFILLGVAVIAIFFLCRYLLQRFWHLDHETSTLASTPGHMSYILSLSLDSKADIATVSVIQSIRVLALTLAIPLIITVLGFQPVAVLEFAPQVSIPTIAFIFAGSICCATIFEKLNISAAFLLAGMFVSSLTFVSGSAEGAMPQFIYIPTIIVMGTMIGTRLSGISKQTIIKAASSGIILMLITVLFSCFLAWAYSMWSGLPFAQLLIAFAPGGLETMIAMSLLLDADPAYVAAHHVWRLLVLTILAPVMLAQKHK